MQRQLLDKQSLGHAPELKRADEVAHLSAQLDAAISMWTYYRERSEKEFKRRAALDEKLRQLEDHCRQLESQIQAMRNSRSWRLTAPYRKLGSLCRRLASLARRRSSNE